MLQYRVAVDWENKGMACFGALPTDALNLYPDPLFHSSLLWEGSNVNIAVTKQRAPLSLSTITYDSLPARFGYGDYATPVALQITPSNVLNEYAVIGSTGGGGTRNIPVTVGQAYTFAVWFRVANTTTLRFSIEAYNSSTTSWSEIAFTGSTYTAPQTTNFYRIRVQGNIGINITHIRLVIQFNSAHTAADLVWIRKLQVTNTTLANAPEEFNSGHASSLYDDISADVLNGDTFLGTNEWDSYQPDEGTFNVTVKNIDRKYSPEYNFSPLYEKLKLNRRVFVQRAFSTRYDVIWCGWVSEYTVKPDNTGERTATIKAIQGVDNLSKIFVSRKFMVNPTLTEILEQIVANPVDIPAHSHVARLDWSYLEGASYLYDPSIVIDYDTISADPMVYNVVGHNWSEDLTVYDVLTDLAFTHVGSWFLHRTSQIKFYTNSYHKFNNPHILDLEYSDLLRGNNYVYENDLLNEFTGDFVTEDWDNSGTTAVTLYEDTIRMTANEVQVIQFNYNTLPENSVALAMLGDAKNVNIFKVVKTSDNTIVTPSTVSVGYAVSDVTKRWNDVQGSDIAYTGGSVLLLNTNAFEVEVSFRIRGYGLIVSSTGTAIYQNQDSMIENGRKTRSLDQSSTLFMNFTNGTVCLAYLGDRFSVPQSYFEGFSYFPEMLVTSREIELMQSFRLTEEYQTDVEATEYNPINEKNSFEEAGRIKIMFDTGPKA